MMSSGHSRGLSFQRPAVDAHVFRAVVPPPPTRLGEPDGRVLQDADTDVTMYEVFISI